MNKIDFKKLLVEIEHRRYLQGLASLPFIIKIKDEIKIIWFNFYINDDNMKVN